MDDEQPSFKPFRVDYAKSGRSSCRGCKTPIAKECLRIARVTKSHQFDGVVTLWFHAPCAFKKPNFFKSLGDVENIDTLRWEDQQRLSKYLEEGGESGKVGERKGGKGKGEGEEEEEEDEGGEFVMEYSKSGQAKCKKCEEKIGKGEIRIGKITKYRGKNVPLWHHLKCMIEKGAWKEPWEKLPGWEVLKKEDKETVKSMSKGQSGETKGKTGGKRDKSSSEPMESEEPKSKKRKTNKKEEEEEVEVKKGEMKGRNEEEKSSRNTRGSSSKENNEADNKNKEKKPVLSRKGKEVDISKPVDKINKKETGKNGKEIPAVSSKDVEFDKQMEAQTRKIWEVKDNLTKNVPKNLQKEMLSINGQDQTGSEQELRERCADGMLFGRLSKCSLCSSPMEYSDGQYRCRGFLSAWSKCSFTTREDIRKYGDWKIPTDTENSYLLKWKEEQEKMKKSKGFKQAERLLPPLRKVSTVAKTSTKVTQETGPLPEGEPSEKPLEGLRIAFVGKLKETQSHWKERIEKAGGRLLNTVSSATTCVISTNEEAEQQHPKLLQARENQIPILREEFLTKSIEQGRRAAMTDFSLSDSFRSVQTVKVKGRSAVHTDSGLEDKGHILDYKGSIYNATLNMSDLVQGNNSYYILQIIEEDKSINCHLFRKWGRVGNSKVGSQKIEELDREDAISDFKRLFLEKTGNSWKSWEEKDNFEKQPGKFYPLEIDYGTEAVDPNKSVIPAGSKSQLDPRLVTLMKIIFDVETFKEAMIEFEINVSEMPLGKLTKRHIERGFQVLTDIQNLIQKEEMNTDLKEGKLRDSSNQFFTLIPTVQPKAIRTTEALEQKVRMLETLRDIEIASKMIGEVEREEDPVDSHYRQLSCHLEPLDHSSEDFALLKEYLTKTHAPTHTEWGLELEDAFMVNRKGEEEAYAPFKDSLSNKMLLWHGSRTSNYAGILSQGLRIAPKEAPVTGYMFGKGVYFADLVSKSAQYCFSTKKSPTGIMLLSEVALGESYELKKAQYVEKLPRGKHSTKGVGRLKPEESGFKKWREDVLVPSGKPVPSGVRSTDLQYNEYIVYNRDQIKLQFLLKVKFNYKR